ncbi:KTSC domain-containing protein [Nocardioides sp.]|jgi:hypothetical protein|uniref:KTSC domain-containing protein n=1 Tax=Nocardioides sp. TaxID=35761 RepID=UPI002C8238C1|nr:KTSC domain-containing protein [Nocardioides sp.]HVX53380.1 KTSC domain-containing protein [Nocardioides sp.]
MEMVALHRSRAVAEVGYDPDRRALRVRFRHGGLYEYRAVPPEVFLGLLDSAHPWTEWQEHIKATYDCDRLE